MAPVYFYGVAHSLEGMERQAYGQDDPEQGKGRRYVYKMKECIKVGNEEVAILKEHQDAYVADKAQYQEVFSFPALRVLDNYTGYIIYNDGKEEDKNINGYEGAIENTTCNEQVEPPQPVR